MIEPSQVVGDPTPVEISDQLSHALDEMMRILSQGTVFINTSIADTIVGVQPMSDPVSRVFRYDLVINDFVIQIEEPVPAPAPMLLKPGEET